MCYSWISCMFIILFYFIFFSFFIDFKKATKMSQSKPSLFVCTPETVVNNSFRALGTSLQIIPYFPHRVCSWFVDCFLFFFVGIGIYVLYYFRIAKLFPESFISEKMLQFNQKISEVAIKKQLLLERKRGTREKEGKIPQRRGRGGKE